MNRLFAIVTILVLAGCAAPGGDRHVPASLGYSTLDKIAVDVKEIEVIDRYLAPFAEPNVDHMFATTPTMAVHGWVKERLVAGGTDGKVEIAIVDASVVEKPLLKKGGVEGFFTDEQDMRYAGRIELEIRASKPSARYDGLARIVAERSTTVAESDTLAERERMWGELTSGMMSDLDGALERAFREKLPQILRAP